MSWIIKCLLKDSATYALQDLDKAYDNFFKRGAGYPKPRRFLDNNSYKAKIYIGKKLNLVFGKSSVKIPKVGRVEYKKHKILESLQLLQQSFAKELNITSVSLLKFD